MFIRFCGGIRITKFAPVLGKALLIGALICSISTLVDDASAEVSLENFEKFENDETVKTYLYGVAKGYEWSNAALKFTRKQEQLFCAPSKVSLNQDNYLTILHNHIKTNNVQSKYGANFPVELILLDALRDVFPCENTTESR
jgi:hypothetical protein